MSGRANRLGVVRSVSLRDELAAGVVGGLVAGLLIQVFLQTAELAQGAPASGLGQRLALPATVVLGPAASTSPLGPPLGMLIHLAISVGWGLGYAYLARTTPHVLARPWLSGLAFGLVVYVFMSVVLIAAGQYYPPSPPAFATALAAHLVFFGLPLALVVAAMLRRR